MFKLKNILSSRLSFKENAFGWDGLSTFIISNILLVVTLGLVFVAIFVKTIIIAYSTGTSLLEKNTLLVAGLRLENDQPVEEFKTRLNRVLTLSQSTQKENEVHRIIILGGLTGNNNMTEARAGADYLMAQGIAAERIILEDHSRHTLENIQNARILLLNESIETGHTMPVSEMSVAIISSRYHLYRILTLARGLNLFLQPVAAEDDFSLSFINVLRLFKEAYYLHWYWSGKLWVMITGNKKSQARIS